MAIKKQWIQAVSVAVDDITGELQVHVGGSVTPMRNKIDAADAAVIGNTLIGGEVNTKICVLAMCLIATQPVDVTLYTGPADTGTALSGPVALADNGGFVLNAPADPAMHWFETVSGQALTLKLSLAVQVSGWLVYYQEITS